MKEFTELPQFTLVMDLIRLLDEEYCRTNQVVVLGPLPKSYSSPASLGMLDTSDEKTLVEVEQKIGRKVKPIQLNAYEINRAIDFGYGKARSLLMGDEEEIERKREPVFLYHDTQIKFSRDQTIPEILIDTLSEAVTRRATDIHIETYENDVDLRFRIDGLMHQVTTPLSAGNVRAVISHIKILAELDISDRRNPQDGRLLAYYYDKGEVARRISFRASILPGPFGEDAVLRVLDEGRTLLTLNDLGMNSKILERFQRMVKSPGGMILVTGPTASGKTTTLYAAIQSISLSGKKILTVEDPIELEIPKVNQKQVTSQLSFAAYARAFMRQNPDVLMIGEVRDEETALIALKAAQMGHLVLTTLHTPDSVSAIGRLGTLGVDRALLVSTLLGVLSQRLVRKICKECKRNHDLDATLISHLPWFPKEIVSYKGQGCKICGGTGFFERIGVFELLEFDDSLREQIALGFDMSMDELSKRFKFDRLYDDAVSKVEQGTTTIEEVIRTVPLRSNRRS